MRQAVKDIRVLHLTYNMGYGGTEQVIVNLVRQLQTEGMDNRLFCLESPIGELGKRLADTGIPITADQRKPKLDFGLIRRLRKHLLTERIDVLHCHQYTPYVYGLLAALGLKCRVIFTEHGRFYPDTQSWKRRLLNPIFQYLTDGIVAISEATRRALIEVEGFAPHRVVTLYNGIIEPAVSEPDATLAVSLGLTGKEPVFGTVARLDPIKNQEMMLKAFAEVAEKYPGSRLLIVGDGPLKQELGALALSLGVEGQVIFTGFQSDPERYLMLMDVFLLPSLSEGTSMTLLEAMSLGKPAVVTDAGGSPEIVRNEHSGLIIPNNDQAALVAAMLRIGASRALQLRLGEQARQEYQQRFTVAAMARQYRTLYQG